MVDFAGWEMPVQYDGIREEHVAVRTHAGMFDVSHMGRIEIEGPAALKLVMAALSNDASRLSPGQAQYSLLLDDSAGVIDDLFLYRLAGDRFLVVTNAANHPEDLAEFGALARGLDVFVRDVSDRWAMIAVQGPNARSIVGPLLGIDLPARNGVIGEKVGGRAALVCGTGYTGEDGIELLVDPDAATAIWAELLDAGVVPCGLGARDTLRLEACFHLHGNDLDRETDPIAAGLGWACRPGGGYRGSEVIQRLRTDGTEHLLVPFVIEGEGIPRGGNPVLEGERVVGVVTSGTFSPSLEYGIGLASLETPLAEEGRAVVVDVRGKHREARVSSKPLYPPRR
jgi:aminomethyltransferase